jgi:hypothetical protein
MSPDFHNHGWELPVGSLEPNSPQIEADEVIVAEHRKTGTLSNLSFAECGQRPCAANNLA